MAISAGTQLGPYEVIAPIGKGGMGEVYRARDPRLGRDVAIKVSSEQFSERFEREARAIAALNHPNICQLYDVGPNYLVMELVEGESPKGPLPLADALRFAAQIADALDAAHEKGIVHRDLKPGNIKIKSDGTVKVLDFGLAKMGGTPAAKAEDSPTITLATTQAGMILGTAAYMSPEQARGKEIDRRADIWAFGVVLYEMLTGRQLFHGEDVGELLASVIKDKPDLTAAPPQVQRLLASCLEKDPKQRLQAAGDYRLLLDQTAALPAASRPSYSGWIAAAVLALIAVAVSFIHFREAPPRVLKMSVLPPEKATFKSTSIPAVSPDGRRIAFVATLDGKDQLWVRDLDSLSARALTGTEGASYPFWSPDSRTIGFFADNELKKIDMAGGPPLTLCDAVEPRGGTWGKNSVIVFGVIHGGTFRVAAAGGNATPATTLDESSGETNHRYPWFLPNGHHFLYTAVSARGKQAIYVGDLVSKDRKLLVSAASNAVYTPPGYLLFVRERTLMAQPFDVRKLQTTGDAVPIAEQIDSVSGILNQNQFSASENGVLAYRSGGGGAALQLTWFDRSGKTVGTLGAPGRVNLGAISPDGKTVAVDRLDPQTNLFDIWLYDLARGTASRFTFGPKNNIFPVWSADGSRIVFISDRDGIGHPFQKSAVGTAPDEVLSKPVGKPPLLTRVNQWSRDGHYLILYVADTKSETWVLPLFGDRRPLPYLHTAFNEAYARLSPNGQWLAYTSDESKRNEIYVQTFPTRGGKWQISTNGGLKSIWSRDGKELYFLSLDGKMMAADIKGGGTKFEAGVPKPLLDVRFPGGDAWFDVGPDGRFLIPVELEQTANAPLTVVVNWTALLKK